MYSDDILRRFHSKYDKTDYGCWLWTGHLNMGYGQFFIKRKGKTKRFLAHRFSFSLVKPIPRGMTLDHLCRVRHCVNPAHLEPVSNAENVLRGNSPTAIAHRTGLCGRGHPLGPPNSRGQRPCPICRKGYKASAYWKKRAEVGYKPRPIACKKGHPYVEGNFRMNHTGKKRICLLCKREGEKRRYHAKIRPK